MNILITGASGFVGRKLCIYFLQQGHNVRVISRQLRKFDSSIATYQCDLSTQVPDASVLEGVEAIVNLAGEPIGNERWTANKKARIYSSRVNGTRNLVVALERMGAPKPKVIISTSAIGIYGDRADEILAETSEPGSGFLAEVCQAWEESAHSSLLTSVRLVVLRMGVVLGRGGGALEQLLPIFRAGLGGPIGKGEQWMSWIHLDDLVSLIDFSLRHDRVSGVLNAVSPHPETNASFGKILASAIGRTSWLPVPTFILKASLGERAQIVLSSQLVVPKRCTELGFKFAYPALPSALQQIFAGQIRHQA